MKYYRIIWSIKEYYGIIWNNIEIEVLHLMVCHQSEIKERLWCRVHNRRLVWFWLKKNYFSRMVWFWPRKNYLFGVVWFWPTKIYFSGLVWFWPKDNNFPGLGGFCWSKEARFQYQAGDHHTLLKCVTLGCHQGDPFFKYEDEGQETIHCAWSSL